MQLLDFVQSAGLIGIWTILFAESGVFLFFLPGDSLLLTAGLLASQEVFRIFPLAMGSFLAATSGSTVGYGIGRTLGTKLVSKHSKLLSPKRMQATRRFFNNHGSLAIIFARFVPVVRTFLPVLAGMSNMPFPKFMFFNTVGAGIWAVGLLLLGYYLGNTIPGIEDYLLFIAALIIVVSILPNFWKSGSKHTSH